MGSAGRPRRRHRSCRQGQRLIKVTKVGEYTVDVTEDIELWYTGAAVNRGWIMTLERDGEHIYLASPYTPGYLGGGKTWKLQITFEPQ